MIRARWIRFLAECGLCTVVGMTTVAADDWARFRGNNGNGLPAKSDQKIPTSWSDSENLVWKVELPGIGASSPVLYKNRLYVTAHDGYGLNENEPGDMSQLERKLLAIDPKDGKVLWSVSEKSTTKQEEYKSFTLLHGYASGTPAVDDSGVYVYYGTTGLVGYDLKGKKKWLVPCGDKTHVFGTSNSPVIYKDLVIINASVESGELIGVNKNSGEVVWKQGGMDASWNTPIIVNANDRDELVLSIKGKVVAYNPATGDPLWNAKGIDDYICPSVIAEGDVVYACGGRSNTIVAIKAGGSGDVSESNVVWRLGKGSNVSSPIVVGGKLYWFSEGKGIAYSANAKTGELIYEKRIEPKPERFYASPVASDGNLFFVSRQDGTFVVPASDEFKITKINKFESDTSIFNASPIVDSGRLYLRSNKYLYCVSAK